MIRTLLLALLSALPTFSQAPDVIYYHASIITMSPRQPVAEAVAIRGDRFLAVGSNADVLKTAGPHTQKIDLGGKCMVPGIIESHVHPIGAALSEIDGPVPVVLCRLPLGGHTSKGLAYLGVSMSKHRKSSYDATHEAAHVIAALVQKAPIEGVTLIPKSSEWSGHLILDKEWSVRVVQNEDLAGYEANCVIRLASFALDQMTKQPETGALDDIEWAIERIKRFFPDRSGCHNESGKANRRRALRCHHGVGSVDPRAKSAFCERNRRVLEKQGRKVDLPPLSFSRPRSSSSTGRRRSKLRRSWMI